jgi:hypothetical protein
MFSYFLKSCIAVFTFEEAITFCSLYLQSPGEITSSTKSLARDLQLLPDVDYGYVFILLVLSWGEILKILCPLCILQSHSWY